MFEYETRRKRRKKMLTSFMILEEVDKLGVHVSSYSLYDTIR